MKTRNSIAVTGALLLGMLAYANCPAADQVKHRFFKSGWASGGPAIYDAEFKPEWSLANGAELSDGWVLPDNGVVFSYSLRGKEAGIVRLDPGKAIAMVGHVGFHVGLHRLDDGIESDEVRFRHALEQFFGDFLRQR